MLIHLRHWFGIIRLFLGRIREIRVILGRMVIENLIEHIVQTRLPGFPPLSSFVLPIHGLQDMLERHFSMIRRETAGNEHL
jgi:hypothetical protein